MSYNILRWDVIRFKDSITDVPIVYIKPDASLLAFITTNKGACILEINGTHKPYDGQKIQGVIYQSSELPNPRPVYFKQTGEYIIVLNSGWYGYPTSFGEITFYGLDNAKSSNLKSGFHSAKLVKLTRMNWFPIIIIFGLLSLITCAMLTMKKISKRN